ncbi:hypothetical protein AMECASPLE_037980, partial [Ameca splendens]
RNAKQAAEKHYIETLRGYDVTEDFISSKADNSASERKTSTPSDNDQSDQENAEYKTVHCRKVFLDDEDINFDVENEEERDGQDSYKASLNHLENENTSGHLTEHDCHGDDPHYSDESYHYSDDHENFSEDSEHDVDIKQQESVD